MRKVLLTLLLALFCVNLSGCGPARTQAEINALDYGPYPENYQEIVKNYMSRKLADPYSAHYEFQSLPNYQYKPERWPYKEAWGWGGTVYINSKNKYGAYKGSRSYFYIIRHGEVVLMTQ